MGRKCQNKNVRFWLVGTLIQSEAKILIISQTQFLHWFRIHHEITIIIFRIFSYWMSLHCQWVLKLLEVSWPLLSRETPPSQPNKPRLSPLTQITNQVYSSRFLKVNDRWPRITIFLENSNFQVNKVIFFENTFFFKFL